MSGIPPSLWIGNSGAPWGGGANHGPTHAPRRSHLKIKRSTYNEYTLEEGAKMGRFQGYETFLSAFRWQADV